MPRKITWLAGAVRDLQRLREFITSENPVAAIRAAQRILEGITVLADNPEAG